MEIGPVDRITTGAVGEPGDRTFFLQARAGAELVTVAVEKQQVELLAASILDILERVGQETEEGPPETEMELEEPLEPAWRVGRLSIGYVAERDQLMLELEELLPELEDEEVAEQVGAPEPERIRLWATRSQMLALSRHGAAVAARGRPACRFCGNPIDPEGHMCPAMNGHRGPTRT
jgi:uncharacterized repeat protein (TIGR03847 family)